MQRKLSHSNNDVIVFSVAITSLLPLLLLQRLRLRSTVQTESAEGARVAEGTSAVGASYMY